MHHISDDRIEKLNNYMKEVKSISSRRESLYNENDPLTTCDYQYLTIIEYNCGREEIKKSNTNKASIMLHEIDDYLQTWGLSLSNVNSPSRNFVSSGLIYNGITHLKIYINEFNSSMIKFGKYGWFNYTSEKFKHLINDVLLEESKKSSNSALSREIKMRNLLNVE